MMTSCAGIKNTEQTENTQSPAFGNSGTSAAAGSTESSGSAVTGEMAVKTASAVSADDMFTSRDFEIGYSDETTVNLSDSGTTVSGSGVTVNGSTITVTEKGSYLFTGSLSDGQIVVDAGEEKVQIVLSNASVTDSGSAALYVKSADKVFVTTTENSVNKLASSGEYVNTDDVNIDGAVFAKADITFNGTGTLEISSETAHGIVAKDDLKITGGTYTIESAKKGIDCNESVRIADGSITITSGTDGIHAENENSADKGFVYVCGGNITITSGNDAIDASGDITAADGTVTVTSAGGSESGSKQRSESFGKGGWGGMRWDMDSAASTDSSADTQSDSGKGIKSDSLITISGGTFIIDSADDAVHSNGAVTVTGGSISAKSGDDGIHAETTLSISDGTVNVTESYEGLEGEVISISGGVISVKASDDGMNAAGSSNSGNGGFGGGMMDTDANAKLEISGGIVTVNADGDGLDSNGYLTVSGGTIFVSGPTNSGNGAIDSGISATITGGSIIAAGATGMAENFGSDSTQGSILYTFDGSIAAGTEISLKDANGNVLISYAPEKQFQCAVISTPEVASGSTYTVSAGEKEYSVEMTSNIYGAGSNFARDGFGGTGVSGGRGKRGSFNMEESSAQNGSGSDTKTADNSADSGSKNVTKPDKTSDTSTEKQESSNAAQPDKPAETPQSAPEGSENGMPQMPEGEPPALPDGEMPQQNGNPPALPDGQMPQQDGNPPALPDGEMPQMPEGGFGGRGGMHGGPGGFGGGMGEMPQNAGSEQAQLPSGTQT